MLPWSVVHTALKMPRYTIHTTMVAVPMAAAAIWWCAATAAINCHIGWVPAAVATHPGDIDLTQWPSYHAGGHVGWLATVECSSP